MWGVEQIMEPICIEGHSWMCLSPQPQPLPAAYCSPPLQQSKNSSSLSSERVSKKMVRELNFDFIMYTDAVKILNSWNLKLCST